MSESGKTMSRAHEVVAAALRTAHERKSGIGSLGSVVAHNLAWDAVIALNEAGMIADDPEPHDQGRNDG